MVYYLGPPPKDLMLHARLGGYFFDSKGMTLHPRTELHNLYGLTITQGG